MAGAVVGVLVLFRPKTPETRTSWQDMAHEPHDCPQGSALITVPATEGWLRTCRSIRTWREDGPSIQWRAGRPYVVGGYRDGVRVGTWRTFDPGGRVLDEVHYGQSD